MRGWRGRRSEAYSVSRCAGSYEDSRAGCSVGRRLLVQPDEHGFNERVACKQVGLVEFRIAAGHEEGLLAVVGTHERIAQRVALMFNKRDVVTVRREHRADQAARPGCQLMRGFALQLVNPQVAVPGVDELIYVV